MTLLYMYLLPRIPVNLLLIWKVGQEHCFLLWLWPLAVIVYTYEEQNCYMWLQKLYMSFSTLIHSMCKV